MFEKQFSKKDEEQYRIETYKTDLPNIRRTLLICILFYSSFTVVDYSVGIPHPELFTYIRYFGANLTFIVVYALSFHKSFYKYHQILNLFAYIIAGLGIIAMLAIEPLNHSYYSGLFLIFATGHLLVRIRPIYITIGSFIIILTYALVAKIIIIQHNPDAYFYLVFYVGVFVLNVFGSYTHDRYHREKFEQVYIMRDGMITLEKDKLFLEAHIRNQQRLDSIGTLASGVAHEINNPINGIMNYGQIIAEAESVDQETKEYAKEIIRETKRVSEIVKNLLDFSRQNDHEFDYACIEDIVSKTLSLANTLIKHDQIDLYLDFESNLPMINCRSQQIQQVLMNLITNARDSLNEKSKLNIASRKVINIRCKKFILEDNEWLEIIVEDYGMGISDQIKNKIFDPFFTTKGKDKGTGLGLSISYGIISEHGGEILMESEEGLYTRFIVQLPCEYKG